MSGADTAEVARTAAEAAAMPQPPLLVVDPLREYLSRVGLADGELRWERIGDGHSNVTYLIETGGRRLVLRRGPRPPLPPTTHDMVREARIQSLLADAGVPVPRILGVCADDSVLGVPFYLMEHLDGVVITDALPAAFEADRGRVALAAVDALVALHAVDASAGELATVGRAEGYLERQVRRFAGLWPTVSRRDLPEVGLLATWLASRVPTSAGSGVVHGDFRIGNLMYAASGPARVQAILDWEMATLGDPLADLGYLVATYADPDAAPTPLELTPVTRGPGFPRRADLVERYAAATGADVAALDWYRALALFKAAVFCEAMHTRWLDGERPGDVFAPTLTEGVPRLLDEARHAAGL